MHLSKKDKTWIGSRAKTIKDKYDELAHRSSGASDDNASSEPSVGNNMNLCLEASGGQKGGRIFGLGSLGRSCRVTGTSSSNPPAVRAKINQLIEEVRHLKEQLVQSDQKMRQRDQEINNLRQQQNFIMQHLQLSSVPRLIPPGNGVDGDNDDGSDGDGDGDGDNDDGGDGDGSSSKKGLTNGASCRKRKRRTSKKKRNGTM